MHVHEPFAPSAASAALRHSRALNVGSFHARQRARAVDPGRAAAGRAAVRPPGRAHRVVQDDARPAPALLPGRLPRDRAGRRPGAARGNGARAQREVVEIVYVGRGGALGAAAVPARAAQAARRPALGGDDLGAPARARCRRSRWPGRSATACGSSGPRTARRRSSWPARRSWWRRRTARRPSPGTLLRGDGRRRRAGRRAAAAVRGGARRRRARPAVRAARRRDAGRRSSRGWSATPSCARRCASACAAGHDDLDLVARGRRVRGALRASSPRRRHDTEGKPAVRKRLAERELIAVDLHMHTNHSHDCATPVEKLLETAKARGPRARSR